MPILQHVKSGRIIECSVDQDTPMVMTAVEEEQVAEEPAQVGEQETLAVVAESSPTAVPSKEKARKRSSKFREVQPIPEGHNCYTHFPKDPNCPVCATCKHSDHNIV